MNVFLWIVQGVLAAVFLMAGAMKVTQPRDKLQERMDWVSDFSDGQIRVIGALEVLGAIGLIVPALVGGVPILVAWAAVGLGLLMIGAAVTHARRGNEAQLLVGNMVLLILAAVVAWARFGREAF